MANFKSYKVTTMKAAFEVPSPLAYQFVNKKSCN